MKTQSVVIISGKGRAFTSGFDLREFSNKEATGTDGAALGREMADAVDRMKPVTIASLHGHCIGGGVVLAERMRSSNRVRRYNILHTRSRSRNSSCMGWNTQIWFVK